MPRWNLRIATLGEGWCLVSYENGGGRGGKKLAYNLYFNGDLAECEPGDQDALMSQSLFSSDAGIEGRSYSHDGHEHGEPKLLHAEQGVRIRPPHAVLDVVRVAHHHKGPGCLQFISTVIIHGTDQIHTARPSHPIKRWCRSKTLWW